MLLKKIPLEPSNNIQKCICKYCFETAKVTEFNSLNGYYHNMHCM